MIKDKIINKGKKFGGKKKRWQGWEIRDNVGDNYSVLYIMYEVVKRELLIKLLKYIIYYIFLVINN